MYIPIFKSILLVPLLLNFNSIIVVDLCKKKLYYDCGKYNFNIIYRKKIKTKIETYYLIFFL